MAAAAAVIHKFVLLTQGTFLGNAVFSLLARAGATKLALERNLTTALFYARHPLLLQQLLCDSTLLRLLLGTSAEAEQHLLILHHHRTGQIHVLAALRAAEELRESPFVEYFSRGTAARFNDQTEDIWNCGDMRKMEDEEEGEEDVMESTDAAASSYIPARASRTASAPESCPSVQALTTAPASAAAEDVHKAAGCASAQETKNFFKNLPPEFAELFHEEADSSEDPLTAYRQGPLSEDVPEDNVEQLTDRSTKRLLLGTGDENSHDYGISGAKLAPPSPASTLPDSPSKAGLKVLPVGGELGDASISYMKGPQSTYNDTASSSIEGQFFKQQLRILVDLLRDVEQNAEVLPADPEQPSLPA